MKSWEYLVIKPSAYISSFCYSILRLEPWSTCSIGCIYCYARWYRGPHGAPRPQPHVLRVFEKLAERLRRIRHPPPFFRLATLSEPLQRVKDSLVYRFISIAVRSETPLILNTKLPSRLLSEPLLELLGEAADRGLVLVQVSVAFDDYTSLLLEPNAEPPSKRLEAIRELARQGIPVAVRVQPLAPGFEQVHLNLLVKSVLGGARHVIGESLRLARSEVSIVEKLLSRKLQLTESYELHSVEGREGLLQPSRVWREAVHLSLMEAAEGLGATYGACKDALLAPLPPRDCCGAFIAFSWYALRPTIREAVLYRMEYGRWPSVRELCEYAKTLSEHYVCSDTGYPSIVSRALRMHERRLERILKALSRGEEAYQRLIPLSLVEHQA